MGLELKESIIIGASNIVTDIENPKESEKAGAAAMFTEINCIEEKMRPRNLRNA